MRLFTFNSLVKGGRLPYNLKREGSVANTINVTNPEGTMNTPGRRRTFIRRFRKN